MTKKEIDKILEKYNKDVKRHISVLQEDFKDQVKIIAEQHEAIISKLDNHEQRLTEIDSKLDNHEQRLTEIDSKLGNHEQKLTKIEETLQTIKLDIEFIKHELKQKVGRDEFAALEKRVSLLEAKINQLR